MKAQSLLDAMLARSPAQAVFSRRSTRRLTVLAYHGVDEPASFERQLDHLREHAHPVSFDQVVEALDGGGPLPDRAVLVTFDDGDRSLLEAGLPRLEGRGIPALAFVVAGWLDGDRAPWWVEAEELSSRGARTGEAPGLAGRSLVTALKRLPDERRRRALAELRRAEVPQPRRPQLRSEELPRLEAGGVRIGSHSLTHPCLSRCSAEQVEREVLGAHRLLTGALGRPPVAFAYPDGEWDPRAAEVLARLGYRLAFLFDHRVGPFPPPAPLAVSRVRVNASTPLDRYRILLSGLHPAIHGVRRRVSRGLR